MAASTPETIEKLMSLTEREFQQTLAKLGEPRPSAACGYEFSTGEGTVTVTFEPVAGVRLGGLLELPRAKVRLMFRSTTAEERYTFLKAFEFTFQRGGG